jgi:type VI secretion system secreted protein VgrG
MRSKAPILLSVMALAGTSTPAHADLIALGSAGNFAVLAGSTVTNTGATTISGGDVGVSPGTAITGFPPATIAAPYGIAGAAAAAQAQGDLTSAYNAAAALAPTQTLSGDLGGLTLTPGVYSFASAAQLTGMLTLDDMGDPNAQFVFQVGSALTTASGSSVVTIDGGMDSGSDVFWQVGSSATLGTGSAFQGHILALASITLDTGATIVDGSALARDGAVTLDTNIISNSVAVPEPVTMTLALLGGALLGLPALASRLRGRPRVGDRRNSGSGR